MNESIKIDKSPVLVAYTPRLKILGSGSTSIIAQFKPGVILKSPRLSWWHSYTAEEHSLVRDIKHNLHVEEEILRVLGEHPRIIRFLGTSEDPRGLLLAEASDGNLQDFIDKYNESLELSLRMKWRSQAAEAVQFIHNCGVIHSDLRPENYLVHTDPYHKHDLMLCDFGGSTSSALDGGHLPDSGFFNPAGPWISTESTDIFSLGSIFYTMMTGHWPYKFPGSFSSIEEKTAYESMVDERFASGVFPTVDHLVGGSVIHGCWTGKYEEMGALIQEQRVSISNNVSEGVTEDWQISH